MDAYLYCYNRKWSNFDPTNSSFYWVSTLSAIGYPLKVRWWCVKRDVAFLHTIMYLWTIVCIQFFSTGRYVFFYNSRSHLFPDLIAGS